MIEKIAHPAYENNVKKLNEVIDRVNVLDESAGNPITQEDLDKKLSLSGGTMTGSIILPSGIEIF